VNRSLLELPNRPGAYRWYYADVTAGDVTAVVILMVGAVFSPRYSIAVGRGGRPTEHCAVNLALYRGGARWHWVLSEYPAASVEDGRTLRIGASSLHYAADGRVVIQVVDRTAPWGRPTEASLELTPEAPAVDEVQLVEGQPHFWQPLAPRARATLKVQGEELTGRGYHDTNRGEEPLGSGLPGWQWLRVHRRRTSEVIYRPRGSGEALHLISTSRGSSLERIAAAPALERRTAWGLNVPRSLMPGHAGLEQPRLLESSPFYARLESRLGPSHALGEVADFEKFHRPYLRWMAHFRTREGSAA